MVEFLRVDKLAFCPFVGKGKKDKASTWVFGGWEPVAGLALLAFQRLLQGAPFAPMPEEEPFQRAPEVERSLEMSPEGLRVQERVEYL